jgi:hypothetical protein
MNPYQDHAVMQEHIAQWQSSELTQTASCKEHGIKPHIFSYYKKKFSSDVGPIKPFSRFIPVKLLADAESYRANVLSSSDCNLLRLTHTNGFSLEINPHAELSSLKPLLELLRSLS